MSFPGDTFLVPALLLIGGIAMVLALVQLGACLRHARSRRPFAAMHRLIWTLVFILLAALSGGAGLALRGYRLLTDETQVATIGARQIAPQQFSIHVDFPDGHSIDATLHGDEWQLDARIIKWRPAALQIGAQPLYRLDRLSGRYRDPIQAQATLPNLIPLGNDSVLDLWQFKRQFPQWLPWIDADYGSAAYLPLIDGARYTVSLSPLGGLVARPADADSAQKLKQAGW